ncbi:unnamed protein product [Psylliodes chrysocephalus]|uniref:Uncharacterized protein n=1 Tax=Psylliodes chrysocephalus TaxID=3402493 RepID=A0A9P0CPD4_9CUCU|nr:unnamed protein product [Psylliodes chrysocephala]
MPEVRPARELSLGDVARHFFGVFCCEQMCEKVDSFVETQNQNVEENVKKAEQRIIENKKQEEKKLDKRLGDMRKQIDHQMIEKLTQTRTKVNNGMKEEKRDDVSRKIKDIETRLRNLQQVYSTIQDMDNEKSGTRIKNNYILLQLRKTISLRETMEKFEDKSFSFSEKKENLKLRQYKHVKRVKEKIIITQIFETKKIKTKGKIST